MPCGGIYPIAKPHPFAEMHGASDHDDCFFCGHTIDPGDLMFCDEWDCYLHRSCVLPFLTTEEGKIVLAHGHQVVLYFERDGDGDL